MFFILAREIKLCIFVNFFLKINQLLFVMSLIHSLNRVLGSARQCFVALASLYLVIYCTKSEAYSTI